MLSYVLRRIARLIPTLLVIISIFFAILRLPPGGPLHPEQTPPPALRAHLERLCGLDAPLPLQYLRYLGGLAHGDFGPSLRQRDFTVRELMAQGLPVSVTLGVLALLLALALSVPAGVAAALGRGGLADHGI